MACQVPCKHLWSRMRYIYPCWFKIWIFYDQGMRYIYPCWFRIWIFYDQGWVIYIQVGLRSEYFCLKAVAHFLQFKTIKSKMMLISTYLITVSRVPLRIRHVLLLDGWSLEIYNSSLYDQTLVRYKTKFESFSEIYQP